MPANSRVYKTNCVITDPNLAACLLAVGIPPAPNEFLQMVTHDAEFTEFHFLPLNEEGLTFAECLHAWNNAVQFVRDNPRHPMSFAMCAIRNRRHLNDIAKKAAPKFCIKRGASVALIDPTDPQHIQDHLLSKIGA